MGIADGYSRVTDGERPGVFAMQYGPGAEKRYPGVATAYSDSTPILLLPLGEPRERQGILPHFSSVANYGGVTKYIEQINTPSRTAQVMRRAFAGLNQGRPGPVMVEIPSDVALEEVNDRTFTGARRFGRWHPKATLRTLKRRPARCATPATR